MARKGTGSARILWRGLSKRCPRCGEGHLFGPSYFQLRSACSACALSFEHAPEDHIGVMYITTAVQTAFFAFIVLSAQPTHAWLARGALLVAALTVTYLNLPNRKGLAIAFDYLFDADAHADQR